MSKAAAERSDAALNFIEIYVFTGNPCPFY